MFVLVVGGGKLGSNLASMLVEAGHRATVVEQDADRVDALEAREPGYSIVHGDGCEPVVLESAHVSQADVVAAVTGDDEDNLVICLLGRREYGAGMTVARVNDPRNEWLFDRRFGVDVPVSNTAMIAKLLLGQVTVGHLTTLLSLMADGLALVELTVPEGAPSIGVPLAEMALPPDSRLVAIVRAGHVVVPTAETALQPGDEVLAITTAEGEPGLSDAIAGGDAASEGR